MTERLNPKIQAAREVGLRILKPTKKELERGLRLHAESLVFDAYGCSPRAALDGDALAAAVEAGASEVELDDMREEMGMIGYVGNADEQREYLEAWRASGDQYLKICCRRRLRGLSAMFDGRVAKS